MVDVHVETVINRPPDHVAAYAGNPDNAPEWYSNIKSVQWHTQPPMTVGSKLAFSARFLGRTLDYVYEIIELSPGQRLVMRTAQGPFPMQTTYAWTPEGQASTRMVLRNTGSPAGFSKLAGAVMAPMMRRAMRKDLRKLKELLESR
ncbi:SRPBCC family protein [Arthrobacter rhizosphaerae]|uniref:SRPBCC family protein n=1 Tax=Arthrobacter rhizosphaerae TaxID=2855490 RepID=UPI001FF544AB|nr:SRPBCC family protein [Arthrobacter rhizosphaerae]